MKCTRCGATMSRAGDMCDTCGSQVQTSLSDELAPGTVIGSKYRIVQQIGAGGMGRVYRAVQDQLGTTVCVKTLHTGATADPQFAARFEQEARTTSKLRHPNIVTVFDFGTHMDGSMYIVMEFVEGVNLSKLGGRGKVMSATRAVNILGQVCDALSFAHGFGVVHRDLKPANIMISELPGQSDYVKVLDFGSALMLSGDEDAARLTRVGSVIGTPAYMAPEYLLGHGVDARIDVYAVGVLLYNLLTGSPPFRGDAQSVFAQQVSVPAEPPTKRNPNADISPELEGVILRSLIKDPAKRYESAADFKRAMENALAGVADDAIDPEDFALGAGVEIAHQERAVVLVSVCATDEIPDADAPGIHALAQAHGAEMTGGNETLLLIFGLDRDVPEAAADAMKCAIDLAAMDSTIHYKIGVHDAQASCKGRHGIPGFSYELFGDGMDTAEHLAKHVQVSHVMVSGPVSRYVPAELRLTPVFPPGGVDEPTFILTDPLRAGGGVGQLPFVGRTDETRRLLEIAVNAAQGHVCLLEAPAGSGKSRLVREIVPQAARVDVSWCVVPASLNPEIGPAHPVSLLAALGWSSPGGSASTTERYAVDVMLGRRDLRGDGLGGERRQLRLVSAAIDGVARRLEQSPVVIVFDELQDADDLTWSVIHRLVDMAPVLGLSVVLSVRDASDIPFELPDQTLRVTLGGLTPGEIGALASTLDLGDRAHDIVDVLLEASEGSPLLAEEIFRMASLGDLDSVREVIGSGVTASISYLVLRRISSLGASARRVLDASAVLGPEPAEREVLALTADADLTDDERSAMLTELMYELRESYLLYRSPAGHLCFSFPTVRQVALDAMDGDTARDLHLAAAALIEGSASAEARLGEVAEHLLAAGHSERAHAELRRAAAIARGLGASRRAAELLRLATAACEPLGEAYGAERAATARELGQVLIESGHLDEAALALGDAFEPARESGEPELAADLLRLHGTVLVLKGDPDGETEVASALSFAQREGFSMLAARAHGDLAEAADRRGDRDEAVGQLEQGLACVEGREDDEACRVRIQLYNKLGRLELQQNNLTGAIALFTQALSLAERSNDRYQGAGLLGNLGGAYARRGEMERALSFTERALRASEALGDQIGVARQSYNLALIRLAGGHHGAAKQLLRGSYDASRRSGWREGLAMSSAALAKLGAT